MSRNIAFGIAILSFVFGTSAQAGTTGPFSPLSFNNGVVFNDPDNRFLLNLRFRMQNRVEYESASASDLDADRLFGEVRRLRLRLNGHVGKPAFRYLVQLSFSRRDMDWDNTAFPNVIRDAAIIWGPLNWLEVVFGQTKLPGNRQRVISSGELEFPDRSIVNATFNLDRDFGFQTRFRTELGVVPTNVTLAVTTGDGRNTDNERYGLSYTARGEVLPFGKFKENSDYQEGDLFYHEDPRLSVGGGYNFNHWAYRTGGQLGQSMTVPKSFWTGFADMIAKWRGFSLQNEFMYRHADHPVSVEAGQTRFVYNGWGATSQLSHTFRSHWAPAARYSVITPVGEVRGLTDRVQQATLGLSKYIRGHRLKVQAEATREWRERLTTDALTGSWLGRFQVELGI